MKVTLVKNKTKIKEDERRRRREIPGTTLEIGLSMYFIWEGVNIKPDRISPQTPGLERVTDSQSTICSEGQTFVGRS